MSCSLFGFVRSPKNFTSKRVAGKRTLRATREPVVVRLIGSDRTEDRIARTQSRRGRRGRGRRGRSTV